MGHVTCCGVFHLLVLYPLFLMSVCSFGRIVITDDYPPY